jgi:hypothetical protein
MQTTTSRDQNRTADPRRRGQWLWTLLHAPALLAGPAGADGASPAEDDYQRLAAALRAEPFAR